MNIQQAYDQLARSGGGIIPLGKKTYTLDKPLNIHANNVRIIGAGMEQSMIMATSCNAIEITKKNATLYLQGLTVRTRNPLPMKGIGVYVHPKLTANITLLECKFKTVLNSVYYRNHPDKTSLGNILIRNCHFVKASTKTPRDHYYEGLPHKVMLWGAKKQSKLLDVSYNKFTKHPNQRSGAIELCIWGDPSKGKGDGPYTLRQGMVVGNVFKGATRECLAVSDHQKFVVAFNDITDSKRVGLYVIRGYRSDILSNVVRGSLYRGHRLAHLRECLWSWNEVYDSGAEDNTKVGVGGMHISYSHNNIVTNNVIRAVKGYAVAVNNGSSGNRVFNNRILGENKTVFVAQNSRSNEHDFRNIRHEGRSRLT